MLKGENKMAEKIPTRNEVDKKYTWATEDLFATDELWFESLEAAKKYIPLIESYKGKLGESGNSLVEFLKLSDKIELEFNMLANYAFRKSDEDAANSFYLDMKGKLMSFYVEYDSVTSFVTPELMKLEDETLEGFYKTTEGLELYRRLLTKIRARKAHVLSDAEERILAAAGDVTRAPEEIFSAFHDADLRFPDAVDKDGGKHQLTHGSFIPLMEKSDRTLRESAFKTLYGTLDSFKNTSAAFIEFQVKQLMFNAKMRKYNNTMEAALDRTEVPVSVYENLVKTVNENMGYLHKYMALRKKLMGVDELHMYDLYTTIVPNAEKVITFEEAKLNVKAGVAVLGEEYVSMLCEGFENRWIDAFENVGKRSGAYSAGGYPHPYVLLNHKETLDSQFTLAHEMGHALHSYLSMKNQPTVYSDYVIFVAEVASTCNEVLLMRHLLKNTTDKTERAYLINHFLEQFRTTLYRQTMFAEFEMEINRKAENGESLTADNLNKLYYDLNKKYYGDAMFVDKEIEMEWSRIPHFFLNFYVFQYATGFSAAVAIANRILTEGETAVEDYIRFLSSGSITDPISLLKIAGVDMSEPKPVEDALKLFGELIEEMETLVG